MLPKSVTVLGMKYKIISKQSKDDTSGDLSKFAGVLLYGRKEIYINPKQSEENKWRTLFHEMGHATIDRAGLHQTDLLSENLEEIIVETVSSTFFEFFDKKYPKFFEE